jgi:hypothetical protein
MLYKLHFALNSCICQRTDLITVEFLPAFPIESAVKLRNYSKINKIDKSISYVTPVFKIYGQIEKIIRPIKFAIDRLQKHLLSIFVRNIPNHASSSGIVPC